MGRPPRQIFWGEPSPQSPQVSAPDDEGESDEDMVVEDGIEVEESVVEIDV